MSQYTSTDGATVAHKDVELLAADTISGSHIVTIYGSHIATYCSILQHIVKHMDESCHAQYTTTDATTVATTVAPHTETHESCHATHTHE